MSDLKQSALPNNVVGNVKLKQYIDVCIDELSNLLIDSINENKIDDVIDIIVTARNMIICIKEICKARNKF